MCPPGYKGSYGGCSDNYDNRTELNQDHVYYTEGDLRIGGPGGGTVIHGQIVFVAEGNIIITGDIRKSDNTRFPGEGDGEEFVSSSTAHQAILITRNDVIIDPVAVADNNLVLEAMIIAPKGQLIPPRGLDLAVRQNLSLDFKGSLIISSLNSTPRLPEVFIDRRSYSYDVDLRDNPPPYLPAIAEIYYQLEQTVRLPPLFKK